MKRAVCVVPAAALWLLFAQAQVVPNITYLTANNYDLKLDIYQAGGQTAPQAALIYIHGG